MYEHEVKNPFTGVTHLRTIDITEILEKENFKNLKDFITQHLTTALLSMQQEEIPANDKIMALERLIVQLYQPTDIFSLTTKIFRFQEWLFDIPAYTDVINHLKGTK